MKFYIRIVLLAAFLTSLLSAHAQSPTITWDSTVKDLGDSNYEVVFTGKILPGWHTYDLHSDVSSTLVEFEPATGLTLDGDPYEINASKREYDDIFEVEMGTYFDEIILGQKVTLTGEGAVLKGNINWRSCEEENCNSPEDWGFEITIGDPEAARASVAAGDAADQPVSGDGAGESKTLWGLIIEAVLWGFAALLTPCVFPMVPMTVSFFMKGSGSPAAGRFKASMYGFFIVALYTLPIAAIILITRLVGGDAVTADIFNWLATHWLPNLIFFIVFMIFAASFFGAFEITMPSWMVNKTDSKADSKGLAGIFFMALTLVLVSFSCTGPIVGSVLIKSTAGEFWSPIVTMLAFSVAFALPFTLFAFFPSMLKKLPKSGGWLNSVKVVLGFIEVALGMKFLSVADQTYHWGLLDREIYLAVWIVTFSLLGLYLLGKIKFAHDSDMPYLGVGRLALAIITFSFVVYLVPGMWGAPLKGLSGYLPPLHTQDFVIGKEAPTASGGETRMLLTVEGQKPKHSDFLHLPHGLEGFFDLKEAEAYAAKVGKPLFIDFTGHGCVNCREMEARVWADPQVLDILRNDYVIVALYSDDKKVLPEDEWVTTDTGKVLKSLGKINSYYALKTYGVNAQPYYVLQGRNGKQLVPPRGYDLNVDNFVGFLKSGVEAYNAQK
mgnify:CR=1 FL=1